MPLFKREAKISKVEPVKAEKPAEQAAQSPTPMPLPPLLKNVEHRREILLLSQITNNLLKVQTKLEAVERYMEKTLPENSNRGNF